MFFPTKSSEDLRIFLQRGLVVPAAGRTGLRGVLRVAPSLDLSDLYLFRLFQISLDLFQNPELAGYLVTVRAPAEKKWDVRSMFFYGFELIFFLRIDSANQSGHRIDSASCKVFLFIFIKNTSCQFCMNHDHFLHAKMLYRLDFP
jgi:hypothetical protein